MPMSTSSPVATTSTQLIVPQNAGTAASNNPPSATTGGFSRDHTIGNQIRQVIGDGQWNKQVTTSYFYIDAQKLYDTLKADHYKVPIEIFIEKATLPKPVPAPRTYGPQKAKNATKALSPETEPSSSTSKRKQSAKPKSHQPESSKDLNSVASANGTVIDDENPTEGETRKSKEVEPSTRGKRKSSTKETTAAKKRRKTSQPPGVGGAEPSPSPPTTLQDPSAIERETTILSLIKENHGVLEFIPRLDLLYAAHAEKLFPHAQHRVNSRLVTVTLDDLEERREIVRIILQAETSTKTLQYKFIYTLPEIDPITDPKVKELQDQLQKEATSYQPALINEPPQLAVNAIEKRPVTTIEMAQSRPNITGVAVARPGTTAEEFVPTVSNRPVFAPIPTPVLDVATPEPPKKRGRPTKQSKEPSAPNAPIDVEDDSSGSEDGFSH
jgi:hypothetical protein